MTGNLAKLIMGFLIGRECTKRKSYAVTIKKANRSSVNVQAMSSLLFYHTLLKSLPLAEYNGVSVKKMMKTALEMFVARQA